MSRTDAHNPLWVSLARSDLDARANHDHRNGICDLPDRAGINRPSFDRRVGSRTDCGWDFAFTGTYVCCCVLCHAGDWHRIDRRAARHHDSDALHVALGHWRAGDVEAFDDVDVPPRSHWW